MILSDRDIRAAMQRTENPLIIDPGYDPRRLQPASLELTLACDVLVQHKAWVHYSANGRKTSLRPASWSQEQLDQHKGLEIEPGGFWLASTVETVHIPTDLVGQLNGKSSWARQGLIVHTTAGFIDPGFRGQITLELANVGKEGIWLEAGMAICQLVFFQMTSPAERPYGTNGLGSHYMGQQGPTSARV